MELSLPAHGFARIPEGTHVFTASGDYIGVTLVNAAGHSVSRFDRHRSYTMGGETVVYLAPGNYLGECNERYMRNRTIPGEAPSQGQAVLW